MTEEQKYQGALYKPKKQKGNQSAPQTAPKGQNPKMVQRAYVEDVTEEYEAYQDYEIHESDGKDNKSTADLPPEAPTPPPAVDGNVNVFDFLVATPGASNVNLPANPETQLVRYDQDADAYVDPSGYMVDDEEMVHYGAGAVPSRDMYETPVPKAERKKAKDAEKKDRKRKRLHIDTNSPLAIENGPGDEVMTDAPPAELHSGLTGGLNRMMRPSQFPPSPDYSGGDGAENSPASPIKKSKHSKSKSSRESFGSSLKTLMSGSSKVSSKVSKKRKHSSEGKEKKKRHHGEKAPKLIEYRPQTADGKDTDGQLVVFKPRSELFLSMCTKGPDSERGYSMNKALKRFHRERTSSGSSQGKSMEEKELWRSLRMRRNDRGEIVLFSV
jgi:cell growth-regulating nucleolar protein